MEDLKDVSRIEFVHDGFPMGFRNWTLTGFDENNKIICSVDKTDNNNYLKYIRFIVALKEKGYKLRECDRLQLKSGEKSFLMKKFISKATKKDFYKIGKIIGFSQEYIDDIKNKSDAEKLYFIEMVGLEPNEFIQFCQVLYK